MSNDFSSWQQDATPYTCEANVCLDRQLVARFEAAARELDRATRGPNESSSMLEPPVELVERVAALEAELASKTRTFVFEAIGPRRWKKLVSEHPPGDDPGDKKAGFNVETFVPEALVATCTKPGLTRAQADWLVNEQDEGVIAQIVGACFDANLQGGDPKKAAATAAAARSRMHSTPR